MSQQPTNRLLEITRQESGIVLYGVNRFGVSTDGAQMLICNWSPIDGLPRLDPMGYMPMGLGETFESWCENPCLPDIGAYLDMIDGCLPDNIDLVYDANDDVPLLPGLGGRIFVVRVSNGDDITVIAPDGWN